jgi:uncharacterized protein YdeI (YjbR/CyaY-like superfamily)
MKRPDQPLSFINHLEWRTWLQDHHERDKEAWLTIRKNNAGRPGVLYEEAVEEAVCFGWIDGVMKSSDTESYILRFTPRKPNSIWSISNQKRVEKLISEGRMTEAGLAKVREAKENGEWEAAQNRENTDDLPSDLEDALTNNPKAFIHFKDLPPSQKKQLIYWISSARTEATRQTRLQKILDRLENDKYSGSE